MKLLVIGSGGREHAIVWKLAQSPKVDQIYCAPGNAGIEQIAECVDIKVTDFEGLTDFAKSHAIDLIVVGPDDPLVLGIVDHFEANGLRAFGPRSNAAMLEGSKVFSKNLMKKYGIPTANYEVFDSSTNAIAYVKAQNSFPTVVKAEGLALGKGVIIANSLQEAEDAIHGIMDDKRFGSAGNRVVIEEFLTGPEISVLSFCDGKCVVPMVSAQDHKRANDNDEGLNTGGMGAFSPSKVYTEEIAAECMNRIFLPTLHALKSEGIVFKGVIYFGLMATPSGVKVIEYNARFGDPETQAVLPRLKTDLVDVFNAVVDERLEEIKIEWAQEAAVCVIAASGGYPQKYETGYPISGLRQAEESGIVFHAGTKLKDGEIVTSGGRVLGVTAMAADFEEAREKAYEGIRKIKFTDMHYRKDIGIKK